MSAGIERHFLGWATPVVRRGAAWLCDRFDDQGVADLSGVLVVVSGARAGRQLTSALVDEAKARRRPLLLPNVVTPEGMMRALMPEDEHAATEVERWWVWRSVLSGMGAEDRRSLAAQAWDEEDVSGGLRLVRAMDRMHRELAGEGVSFGDVAVRVQLTPDGPRWAALAEAERRFREELAKLGLVDSGHARIERLRRGKLSVPREIVLLGVTELAAFARAVLDRASTVACVSAMVLAPAEFQGRFDAFGCVLAGAWSDVDLERDAGLRREQFRVVQTPVDQADATLEQLEDLGDLSATDIVIGGLDDEVVAHLMPRALQCGVEVRRAEGRVFSRTPAFQLLTALAEYVEAWSFRGLGSLARHADVSRWLARRLAIPEGSWLTSMDEYAIEHLPRSSRELDDEASSVHAVVAAVDELLGDSLKSAAGMTRPLSAWCEETGRIVARLFAEDGGETGSGGSVGYAVVQDVLQLLRSGPSMIAEPRCSAVQAIRVMQQLLEHATISEPATPDAIDILGWLELLADDSKAVVLCGFNEGNVPARGARTLLSDSVRRSLELPTAEARAARDRYLLAALAGSGRRLSIICGRTSDEGDPLLPSRLMFTCSNDEVVRRVGMWSEEHVSSPRRPEDVASAADGRGAYEALARDISSRAPAVGEIERYSVTSFRDYLASPYLYYLKHVLRISEVEEPSGELSAAGFGELIHECLREFGKSDAARATRAGDIEGFLNERLDARIRSRFGATTPVAIRVQREHARGRLRAFSRWQVEHAQEGWTIQHVEWSPATPKGSTARSLEGVAFDVDGVSVRLVGRIDRIDRHTDGRVLLLDYKTAKDAKGPDKTHLAGTKNDKRWIDLQLPLYRLLAESIGGTSAGLGYVCLPMKASEAGLESAEWNESQLESAMECAREVIRQVRRGEFFTLGKKPPEEGVMGWLAGTGFIASEREEGEDEDGGDA